MKKYSIIAAVVLFAACSAPDKKQQLEKLKQERATLNDKIKDLESELGDTAKKTNGRSITVAAAPVKPQKFVHYIDVQGNVDAEQNVTLSARAMGPVTKINVTLGQQVKTGEILAEIDNASILAAINELSTAMDFANEVYKRQEKLYQQEIGTQLQYLQAKNNKESLEKKMISLKEQLELTRIKSPINGTVDGIDIKLGQAIAPGMPCIRVINLSQLKLKAQIAESQSSRVKANDNVIIRFPDLDNREIVSTIRYVSKVINPVNRTFDVEVRIPSDNNFHPNMVGILKIADYENPNAVVIPVNVIQMADETRYVFVTEKKGDQTIARRREIKTGMVYGGLAEVKEGLKEGDSVITVGFQNLNDGDVVNF